MNRRQRFVLAALTGALAAVAAELAQTRTVLAAIQAEGVTLHLAGVPFIGDLDEHIALPASSGKPSGSAIVLPADAQATVSRMHKVAAVAGVAVAVGVFVGVGK
ncbi:MAG TPA: hypothetical protein VGO62_09540 [Myxococcota bacterium]|jgi:hypothetical protein